MKQSLNQLRKRRLKPQLQLRHLSFILILFQSLLNLLLFLLLLRKLPSPQSKSKVNQLLSLRLPRPKRLRRVTKRVEAKSVTEEMVIESQEEDLKVKTESVKREKITVKSVNIALNTRREKSKNKSPKKTAIALILSQKLELSVKRRSDSLRTRDSSLLVSQSLRHAIKKSKKSSMIVSTERNITITMLLRTPD